LLKGFRLAAGLTQEELAELASLSRRGISDLERGVNHTPRKDTVALLEHALGLSAPQRTAFAAAARRGGFSSIESTSTARPEDGRPPLVGRENEWERLTQHLSGDGPPVLLLAGEPGIGKTRLLQEVAAYALGQGFRVLAGGCQRRDAREPYAPILEALSRHIQSRTAGQLRPELQGCAWLAHMLPEIVESLPEPWPRVTLASDQERRLMFGAAARFLRNLAGPAGTLLLLDDLQWAGADAFDLLQSLTRPLSEAPLRIIGAYRATEVRSEHPLAGMLADLAISEAVVRIPLGPLADQDAARLLDHLLADQEETAAIRDQVLRRTGGVPFFVVSYARGVRAAILTDGTTPRVPWNLAQSVRQRLEALQEAARELLGVAAIVGRIVPRPVLMAAMARTESEILPALEAVCQARLLEEAGSADYRFAHDVIREVVEEDLGAARRAALHRRVAEALEEESGQRAVEALAYHFAHSDAWSKAALYLEQAGDRAAAQYAGSTAEHFYRSALDRLDEHERDPDGARVREKLADVFSYVTRYEEALAALSRAAACYRSAGDLEGLGRVTARRGMVFADKRAPVEGLACVEPFLSQYEAGLSHSTQARLYLALAQLNFYSGRYEEQLTAAVRSAELARAANDMRTLISAEMHRSWALDSLDQRREAAQAWETTIRLAETEGDPRRLCSILADDSTFYEDMGEFTKGRHCTERALQEAAQWGDTADLAFLHTRHGMTSFFLGDWSEARQYFERAVAICRRLEPSWVSGWALLDLGRLCLYEGRWEDAARYLVESLDLGETRTDLHVVREVQCVLAEFDLLTGHPEAARARLIPLLDRPGMKESQTTRLLPRLAWAHLELGAMDEATACAAEAISRARDEGTRMLLADALRIQARVSIRRRRWEEAEQAVDEGLTLARAMPYPYAEAHLLHAHGSLLAEQGQPGPARERMEEALVLFQRLGARKDAEPLERAIAALPW